MKLKNLDAAIAEADRFIRKAEALRDSHLTETNKGQRKGAPEYIGGSKLSGASRRASMDLTRALAALRNN